MEVPAQLHFRNPHPWMDKPGGLTMFAWVKHNLIFYPGTLKDLYAAPVYMDQATGVILPESLQRVQPNCTVLNEGLGYNVHFSMDSEIYMTSVPLWTSYYDNIIDGYFHLLWTPFRHEMNGAIDWVQFDPMVRGAGP